MKKNGSISYAILPRQVIASSELKGQKKMKSPSPSIKLQGPLQHGELQQQQLQRMRSPHTIKAQQQYFSTAQKASNQGHLTAQ